MTPTDLPAARGTTRPSRRSGARRVAMQALYQWQLTVQPIGEVEALFQEDARKIRADLDYFHSLLCGVADDCPEIDRILTPALDRPLAQIDPVERAILRLATYELRDRIEVPYRVVINEAVELAFKFGAEQGFRFVNGVLDNLAQQLRPHEAHPERAVPAPVTGDDGAA